MTIQDAMIKYPWLHEILRELPDEMISQVKVRRFKPNDTMIKDCCNNHYTFIILDGICYTHQTSETGDQFTLRKATAGDVVGFFGIYPNKADFDAAIYAKTTLEAAILPNSLVTQCFGTYPAFSANISRCVIERLHALVNLLSVCTNSPSHLAIITYLEYNYIFYAKSYPKSYSGPIEILESRQNIADFLGIDIRSVYRLLKKLTDDGLVSISNRKLYIDRQQYEALHQVRYRWSV
ncbi:Crp/Fnr family transcriptional regulator [uncultured Dysosmobacter sp.]|uniref:Crp/Fnr family transcriptional regulator n=1 Tax=uncultured Dysosmobacter sp. TaxID=2591384 RepID=UPI002616AAF8|nr:Crp/Fnr family transcriptional regulator [uncultured Dysosmobacter sp.]